MIVLFMFSNGEETERDNRTDELSALVISEEENRGKPQSRANKDLKSKQTRKNLKRKKKKRSSTRACVFGILPKLYMPEKVPSGGRLIISAGFSSENVPRMARLRSN